MTFKHAMRRLAVSVVALAALAGSAFAEPYKMVGFGDSLMAGYELAPGESFPDKLQAALKARGHDVVIANAGVSGDTTSGGLARLDWSVPDGTRMVILELGANDMLRGLSPERAEQNLDAMIVRLKERGISVVLMGMMAAPNLGADYGRAFDAIYPRLAEKHGLPLYPFFLDGVAGQTALQLADGMHPSAAGVDVMVERALPVIEQALGDQARGG